MLFSLKILTGKGEKFEACAPEDLWVHDKYVGSWGCDQGMISIFKITLTAPADLKMVFRNLSVDKFFHFGKIFLINTKTNRHI
jgi:hypothetical protein